MRKYTLSAVPCDLALLFGMGGGGDRRAVTVSKEGSLHTSDSRGCVYDSGD